VVAIPSVATEIEQKAVEEVFYKLGVSRVHLIEKSLATATGCGFNVFLHKPVLVVDLGGGLIDIAVISGGGVVMHKTLRTAGEHMNKLLYNYIHLKHGVILGEATCEELKVELFGFLGEDKTLNVRGKSLETGLPKSVKIKTADVKEALLSAINQITDAIKEVVELSPPEVVDEIYTNGFLLTGGLANVPGIDTFFSEELNLKASIAPNKEHATVHGLMRIGRRRETLQRLRIDTP
jgi:rod shape-determining protein MreB